MAADRIMLWQDGNRPTNEEVRMLLEDFSSGVGTITFDGNRWYWALPGAPSEPLKRIAPDVFGRLQDLLHEERWIEFIVCDDHGDVITRHQDPFVRALADGLAATIVRGWKARIE
ncbi:MAG: hypothetical protein Q7R80_00760 [bacterium]|nr:hypothetical protein [bacterium]